MPVAIIAVRGMLGIDNCGDTNDNGTNCYVPITAAADYIEGSMARRQRPRPFFAWILILVLLFLAIGAVSGGLVFVLDPTGGILQIPVEILQGSPFPDFLVPGLILLLVFGVYPLIVVYGLWRRLIWAWPAALLIGPALIIWIVVQISIIGYGSEPPLQLIYGVLGVVILVLTLLPPVRSYYGVL